jgi:hypothetical protein
VSEACSRASACVPRGIYLVLLVLSIAFSTELALAHNIATGDQVFFEQSKGSQVIPYMYFGAKHMVTGYDHLLYLAGVIFFLSRIRDVALLVSLFALGHSITLLAGVLAKWQVSPHLVDAVIGLSVAYKAFENLGGFRAFFSRWLDTRAAVFLFGLIHGLGLSTKLQDLALSSENLVTNMISFNVGVEFGQLAALSILVFGFNLLRTSSQFQRNALAANFLLMVAGFLLMGYQLSTYVLAGKV